MPISKNIISIIIVILVTSAFSAHHIISSAFNTVPVVTHAHSTIRIGPGDSKIGYETTNYATDSRAITARLGIEADLLRVVKMPPLGLPPIPVPVTNPITKEKIDLGRKLFFDRRLSINNTFSCAICHIPEQGFTNHEIERAVGVEGRSHRRNSPTMFNTAYLKRLFHDGREHSLETLVWSPLLAHNEMAMPSMGKVLEKIKNLADYDGLFEQAFDGQSVNLVTMGQALATYNRVLVSANSPFDRWLYGNQADAISDQAIRGFKLFKGKASCIQCHLVGEKHALFTDNQLHNIGFGFINSMGEQAEQETMLVAPGLYMDIAKSFRDIVALPPLADVGQYEITQRPEDRWKYRTPSLRNVALTAPYMHNGAVHDLESVINIYNQGGIRQTEKGLINPTLSPLIKPLGLTQEERESLVAFLQTLTGDNVAELISDAFSVPVGDTLTR